MMGAELILVQCSPQPQEVRQAAREVRQAARMLHFLTFPSGLSSARASAGVCLRGLCPSLTSANSSAEVRKEVCWDASS